MNLNLDIPCSSGILFKTEAEVADIERSSYLLSS